MSGQQQIPYLEERKLIKRWSGPWPMLANMAFTLLIFAVTWWVFQDPRGIMRFYTPYVGYNYCRWWLIILIWMAYIFDFWPFRRDWVRSAHPLQKGLVLALVSVGIMIAMIHGFFEGVLGTSPSLFQPGAAPEARPHRLLFHGIRGPGLHDVRRHRLLDQPRLGCRP